MGENSFRQQILTLLKFKRGDLNCVLATSVAEEGLDIPDCNFIIRFDLYRTLIQYIQSRGRARMGDSEYIHMIESGNEAHLRTVYSCQSHEESLRKFCAVLPEDRKLRGNEYNMDCFLRKEKDQTQFRVPETGAKLNYKQSLVCLASFVASLPHTPNTTPTAEYTIAWVDGGFQCEVILPKASPIKSAIGKVRRTKAVAKCSAAYEMCLKLFLAKYLDNHLRPVFTKQLPAMRNARLAILCKNIGEYERRTKPELWSVLGEPKELYATSLTLANPGSLKWASVPLLLFTRKPLTGISPFLLFFGQECSSEVHSTPVPGRLRLETGEILKDLTNFTLRIFKDIFSKEYSATSADLPYYIAPSCKSHNYEFATAKDVGKIIDWETLKFVRKTKSIPYNLDKREPDNYFTDKFVTDPFDGSRKFYLRHRRHDLKPTDLIPEDASPITHRNWKSCDRKNILNYSNAMWAAGRARFPLREDQPVVEAELLPLRRNLLDSNVEDVQIESRCYLVLQNLKISPVCFPSSFPRLGFDKA
jgi:endoribonuclease Dicer